MSLFSFDLCVSAGAECAVTRIAHCEWDQSVTRTVISGPGVMSGSTVFRCVQAFKVAADVLHGCLLLLLLLLYCVSTILIDEDDLHQNALVFTLYQVNFVSICLVSCHHPSCCTCLAALLAIL